MGSQVLQHANPERCARTETSVQIFTQTAVTLVLCLLGDTLFLWALVYNPFFSQVFRIQPERGHAVATAGPYRLVRHPGYAGVILFELGVATLLASWWALLASAGCALLLILRTALEDRSLQSGLGGYVDYARRVRYRLLPGIW